MKVSTKGRYGLRAMVDLVVYSLESTHVPLNSIAERQRISMNYLEQIFSVLRKAGVVKSIKGAQGGYILSSKPSDIKVGTILEVLEGSLAIVDEEEKEIINSDTIRYCIKKNVWDKVNENINKLVFSITLQDLADEYKRLNNLRPQMYYI